MVVDVVTINPNAEPLSLTKLESTASANVPSDCDSVSQDSGVASLPPDATETEQQSSSSSKAEMAENVCPLKLDSLKNEGSFKADVGTLWRDEWRNKLCRCDTCKVMNIIRKQLLCACYNN